MVELSAGGDPGAGGLCEDVQLVAGCVSLQVRRERRAGVRDGGSFILLRCVAGSGLWLRAV